ncbi:hypothetical protein AB9K35_14560 [Leisingera sp. XS_AS12]|uniref:hypothetical protein n=1 Tax=Roseobacteraceae TaxID=2854170 RepID=UPI00351260EC
MLKLFKNFKYILLMTIVGCDTVGPLQNIAPFPDRPTEIYTFQYTAVRVSGVVWGFERNGSPIIYGGPVGLIYENSIEPAVMISGTGIDLLTASDVTNTNPEQINAFARAAVTFCAKESFTVRGSGAVNIYTDQGALYLVDFCVPET